MSLRRKYEAGKSMNLTLPAVHALVEEGVPFAQGHHLDENHVLKPFCHDGHWILRTRSQLMSSTCISSGEKSLEFSAVISWRMVVLCRADSNLPNSQTLNWGTVPLNATSPKIPWLVLFTLLRPADRHILTIATAMHLFATKDPWQCAELDWCLWPFGRACDFLWVEDSGCLSVHPQLH